MNHNKFVFKHNRKSNAHIHFILKIKYIADCVVHHLMLNRRSTLCGLIANFLIQKACLGLSIKYWQYIGFIDSNEYITLP